MIFLRLFWDYFKIALFTIGGGYAMLPLVRQELVGVYVDEVLFLDLLAISEATPGPFIINMATFIGMEAGMNYGGVFFGLLGSVAATAGAVMPSFVIVSIVTKVIVHFKANKTVQGVLYGIRPVAVGLVISALLMVTLTVIWPGVDTTNLAESSFGGFEWISLAMLAVFMALSFVKIKGKRIDSIPLIIFSAILGLVVFGALGLKG